MKKTFGTGLLLTATLLTMQNARGDSSNGLVGLAGTGGVVGGYSITYLGYHASNLADGKINSLSNRIAAQEGKETELVESMKSDRDALKRVKRVGETGEILGPALFWAGGIAVVSAVANGARSSAQANDKVDTATERNALTRIPAAALDAPASTNSVANANNH